MKIIRTSLILLTLLSACTMSGVQTYEDRYFSFSYPGNWHTMVEVYPDYANSSDYYWLIVDEVISVTSAQKPGEAGATFAVTWIDLPSDMELEGMIQWIYATVEEDIQSFSQGSLRVAEQDGYVVRYQRHWGESWVQFQDVWFEEDKVVYMLSFNASDLSGYEKPIESILESFTLK
jgi:hypothetical protein